ncbi:MAG: ABC-type branched-chain amino acid transport system, ATPase component [Actinomycetia bacterium]|nr:ABC-type branched-chain amino acid transport system, ATPase component [Actinomycetes bacterium]
MTPSELDLVTAESEPAASAPEREPILELRAVRAAYGRIEVLRGVDLAVPEGSVVALLGRNGAGKTTTLNVISGQLPASHGSVMLAGRRVNGASADQLARLGVCTVPEGRGVFPNLTVHENLRLFTYCGITVDEVEAATFARFPKLEPRRRQLAGTLSGGEQQMLALARALATRPAVLLLDELSMGLAPIVVEELYAQVAKIATEGISVLVVEQFARTVLAVADLAAVMHHGTIHHVGTPGAVMDQLSDAYLGGGLS